MKELNVLEIVKRFQTGTSVHIDLLGAAKLVSIDETSDVPIIVELCESNLRLSFDKDGKSRYHDGRILNLQPSKRFTDWSKFLPDANELPDLLLTFVKLQRGTILYSPVVGFCIYERVFLYDDSPEICVRTNKGTVSFDRYGRLYKYANCSGECMLFPSKENRDWSTFKI